MSMAGVKSAILPVRGHPIGSVHSLIGLWDPLNPMPPKKGKSVVKPQKALHKKKTAQRKRMAFGDVGRELGSLFGPIGSIVGAAGGGILDHISGHGSYRVGKNTVLHGNAGPPTFGSGGEGILIKHREFIGDVVSPGAAFALTAYPLNPGIFGSFPYLSTIANSFEEYEMEGLVYEYKTTSATAVGSTNTALGVVMMATSYDPLDPLFQTKTQLDAYEFASSAVTCQSFLHPVECAKKQNPLATQYLRSGAIPSGADIRMYDIGTLQIATQGQQSACTVGELWVTYSVRFRKPRLPNAYGEDINVLRLNSNTLTGNGLAYWVGALPQAGTTMPFSIVGAQNQGIRVNVAGRYIIEAWTTYLTGPSVTFTSASPPVTIAGATVLSTVYAGTGSNVLSVRYLVECVGPTDITFLTQTSVTGADQWRWNLFVSETTAALVAPATAPRARGSGYVINAPTRVAPDVEEKQNPSGEYDGTATSVQTLGTHYQDDDGVLIPADRSSVGRRVSVSLRGGPPT